MLKLELDEAFIKRCVLDTLNSSQQPTVYNHYEGYFIVDEQGNPKYILEQII